MPIKRTPNRYYRDEMRPRYTPLAQSNAAIERIRREIAQSEAALNRIQDPLYLAAEQAFLEIKIESLGHALEQRSRLDDRLAKEAARRAERTNISA